MMDRLGDLQTRIQRWIKDKRGDGMPLYQVVNFPNRVIVREINETGQACVEYSIPENAYCITWHLESTGYFLFLNGEKSADGVFFMCHFDGRIDAHIIECKRTVEASSWRRARVQLQDSLSKILAIVGVLGIELDNVYLGAAFRENRLDLEDLEDPRFGAQSFEVEGNAATSKLDARAQELSDWQTGQVHLRGFAKPFPLTKIQLDPHTGRGTYLTPPNP